MYKSEREVKNAFLVGELLHYQAIRKLVELGIDENKARAILVKWISEVDNAIPS